MILIAKLCNVYEACFCEFIWKTSENTELKLGAIICLKFMNWNFKLAVKTVEGIVMKVINDNMKKKWQ